MPTRAESRRIDYVPETVFGSRDASLAIKSWFFSAAERINDQRLIKYKLNIN